MSTTSKFVLAMALLVNVAAERERARGSTPFSAAAYVWNRALSAERVAEITGKCERLDAVNVLVAELSYDGATQRAKVEYRIPEAARVRFQSWCKGVSYSVRIRPIANLAAAEEARAATALADALPFVPGPLQIDFDAATSQLRFLRKLLAEAGSRRPGSLLSFTALPTWLESSDFLALARAYPGYTLQVHYVQRRGESVVLYDTATADAAITRAGRLAVPFDVALPTYSHVVELGADGRILQVASEGPERLRPREAARRVLVGPSPAMLASDFARWQKSRPQAFRDVIWYRLPTSRDRKNWSFDLWQAVLGNTVSGRDEPARVALTPDEGDPNVYTVMLENPSAAPRSFVSEVTLRWPRPDDPRLFDLLGKGSAQVAATTPDTVTLRIGSANRPVVMAPGERRAVAWARGKTLSMEEVVR